MLARNESLTDVRAMLNERAVELDLRILLIDDDLRVVHDSGGGKLEGQYVLSFENRDLKLVEQTGARYKWADYRSDDTHLTLFAPPPAADRSGPFVAPEYEALIAIPASELSAAWLDLAPRLALACVIALAVSFAVAYLISRSISGPLARITQASREMAQGNYDVHIPISGQDEVGRLSEAFNTMAQEVNSSHRMMRDLLANVSHELKTPLTSIQGFSQAMIDGAVTSEDDMKESVRIIHDEANRMRGLVDDLLLLSQIEMGEAAMDHKHVDLGLLLERSLERYQWALREAGITSAFSADMLMSVHGDERRLEQVFANLLQNAVRHTPPGGRISINAVRLRDGRIAVGVHNTGSYIPAEDLPRVFERFFQVDRARARRGGSSGLGLSIVREIVEAHGGTVHAESDEHTGTEFVVTLPSAERSPSRGRTPANASEKPRRTAKKREAPA
jgi:signal transduction histidine kinase